MADGALPPPKRQRSKEKAISPNEGILNFLKTMEAQTSGNMTYVLRRAMKSIATEQLVIRTHEDLTRIKYVGGYLANQIATFLAENPPPGSVSSPSQPSASNAAEVVSNSMPSNFVSSTPLSNQQTGSNTVASSSALASRAPRMRKRDYVPRFRSGPFAILLALRDAEEAGSLFLSKANLGERAQKYAEEPIHDHRGVTRDLKYAYDGWSSVGRTLIPKNLVIKSGNPARYSLTESGRLLAGRCAEMLLTVESDSTGTHIVSSSEQTPALVSNGGAQKKGGSAGTVSPATSSGNRPTSTPSQLRQRSTKGSADKGSSSEPIATEKIMLVTEAVIGLQADGHSRDACMNALNIVLKSTNIPNTVPMLRIAILSNLSAKTTELATATQDPVTTQLSNPSYRPCINPKTAPIASLHMNQPDDDCVVLSDNSNGTMDLSGDTVSMRTHAVFVTNGDAKSSSRAVPSVSMFNNLHSHCAHPDDVAVMIIDVREKLGRGAAQNCERFASTIRATGIPVEIRRLPVGDALFVWRCLQTKTDSVMDFVAERKTASDFVGSVKDGRIDRQSFSMLNSSFSKRVFVIEGSFKKEHLSEKFAERLHKTLAELSIIHGFLVKRTRNIQETVAFYKSIHAHLSADASRKGVSDERFETWCERMDAFNSRLSITQLFFLQLCRIPGVGKLRAEAIVDMGFTTPILLYQAYRSINAEDRPLFLRQEAKRRGAKPVGPVVSEKVYQFFNASRYDTNVKQE